MKNCYESNAGSESVISIPIANKFVENSNVLAAKQELIDVCYCEEIIIVL